MADLMELLRQQAYLKAGGGEKDVVDKVGSLFDSVQGGIDKYQNIIKERLAAKKAELESKKLAYETTPAIEIDETIPEFERTEMTETQRRRIGDIKSKVDQMNEVKKMQAEASGETFRSISYPKEFDELQNTQIPTMRKKKITPLEYDTRTQGELREAQAVKFRRESGEVNVKNSSDLRKEFIDRPEVKEFVLVNNQIKGMDSLLASGLSGNMKNKLALDQGLITMYNKITDPTSVVRESEYARTPENIPTVNRIIGAIGKIESGGAGLTNEDRKALVVGAKIIGAERGKNFNALKTEYGNLALKYNLDPTLVTGTLPEFKDFSSGKPMEQGFKTGLTDVLIKKHKSK